MAKKYTTLKVNGKKVTGKPKGRLYTPEEFEDKMRDLMDTPAGKKIYMRYE